jgi:DNA helicase HerA-like ATPase
LTPRQLSHNQLKQHRNLQFSENLTRLYVLDEAQNFAPSLGMTASKASEKALAAQARKFGLGMIFATQAPKGIDTIFCAKL